MNKKRKYLTTVGTILFAIWFFLMGMQATFLIINFSMLYLLLYIAEVLINVLLIKIIDLKVKLWEVEK